MHICAIQAAMFCKIVQKYKYTYKCVNILLFKYTIFAIENKLSTYIYIFKGQF